MSSLFSYRPLRGGGANSKKVNTHPKIPEIDLDFLDKKNYPYLVLKPFLDASVVNT